jgi:hypothetical protein
LRIINGELLYSGVRSQDSGFRIQEHPQGRTLEDLRRNSTLGSRTRRLEAKNE